MLKIKFIKIDFHKKIKFYFHKQATFFVEPATLKLQELNELLLNKLS